LWWLLRDTPARREDFKKIINDVNVRFPLKFCAHRWAENVNVIRRALDIWPAIEKYVKHVQEPHNAKIKPSSASYKTIEKAIHNPLTTCRLQFALSLALQLHPFQTKFQSDWPLVTLLPEAVGALLTSVLARFIKHSVLQPAQNNWKELLKIDVSQCSNYRQLDDIDYGFSAKTSLSNLPSTVPPSKILEFKTFCRKSLVALTEKLLKHNPLRHSFLCNMESLSPSAIIRDPDAASQRFENILLQMIRDRRLTTEKCDEVLSQYRQFILSSDVSKFNASTDRLDDFYNSVLYGNDPLRALLDVINTLLALSHGQATFERGFSVNKNMLREGLSSDTIISLRQVSFSIRDVFIVWLCFSFALVFLIFSGSRCSC
jgi:hypothetical protein